MLDDRLDDRRYRVDIDQIDRPSGGAEPPRRLVEPVRRPTREEERMCRRKRLGER